MRNFLDTASIAQCLDDERLTGCLHDPDRMIFHDLFDYKNEIPKDQSLIELDFFRLPPFRSPLASDLKYVLCGPALLLRWYLKWRSSPAFAALIVSPSLSDPDTVYCLSLS